MGWSGTAPNKTYSRTDGSRSGSTTWQQAESAGVDIVSDDHDTHDQDLATSINTSLQTDGKNKMTAGLPAADGSSGLPGYAFAADTNTGFYRKSSGTMGVVSDGTEIGQFNGDGYTPDNVPGQREILQIGTRGHLFGLATSNGSDADHDINIGTGECSSDNGDPILIKIGTALTKQADATFVAGTNAGGMVSGESLPTNGTVHVWAIMKADRTADVCFNNHGASGLSPTLPTDYLYKRRIASLRTDGSANFIAYNQLNDEFLWGTPRADVSANSTGTSAISYTMSVPGGVKHEALVTCALYGASPSANVNALFTSLDQADTAPSTTVFDAQVDNMAGAYPATSIVHKAIRVNTSAQIRARASASSANLYFFITTFGWRDNRGKDV